MSRLTSTHASYLSDIFDHPDEVIKIAQEKLSGVEFDTCIGTGLSGALGAPLLARAMGKTFAIVRKKGDHNHSDHIVDGVVGERWLFVDDLIASGATQQRVKGKMADWSREQNQSLIYVGAYLYYGKRFEPAKESAPLIGGHLIPKKVPGLIPGPGLDLQNLPRYPANNWGHTDTRANFKLLPELLPR